MSCRTQPDPWTTTVSSPVLLGRSSVRANALPWQTVPSSVNGNTAGNSTRLPPLNTSSGRPWSLPSRVPPTRLTFGRTPAQGPVLSSSVCPTGPEFQVEPEAFRVLVSEKHRQPLPITDATCECGVCLDLLGRHRAACPRSGRLRTRAVPTERTLARVCREAGAFVRVSAKLRDMNVEVRADDERAIEVLASGSPSTRERSWLWTSRCVHPSPRQAWRAQGPQQRMVQCWSEPVPTKRRSTPSPSREIDVIWW